MVLRWLSLPLVYSPGTCHLAVTLALLCVIGIGDLDGVYHSSYVNSRDLDLGSSVCGLMILKLMSNLELTTFAGCLVE